MIERLSLDECASILRRRIANLRDGADGYPSKQHRDQAIEQAEIALRSITMEPRRATRS